MNKLFSVIIVSYKNINILRDCLDSIEKFNDLGNDLEVIVSDNSDDDVLFNTIKKDYGWIQIIKNNNNGFGAGNNKGYEISSGTYLLFLNPDTILIEPIFKFAVEKFEEDESLALFGLQLIDVNKRKNCSFYTIDKYGIYVTLKEKLYRKIGLFNDKKMFISGANLFVRRKSFEQAGKFDENIFMYLEEPDLQKRIKLYAESKRIKFFKKPNIIHLEGGTEEQDFTKILRQHMRIIESEMYYSKKWKLKNKTLKERTRYQYLKLLVYKFLGRKTKEAEQKQIINLYKKYL